MIKDFLQFIKKTILAVKLSKKGLYLPLSKLQTFHYAKIPAKLFSSSPTNIDSFFQNNDDSELLRIIQEFLTLAPLKNYPLYFLPCTEKIYQNEVEISLDSLNTNQFFYQNLVMEICRKDFNENHEIYKFWQKNQDLHKDMRLYGAVLEEISKAKNNIYEIDWLNTSKEKLKLNFKQKAVLTNVLSKEAQKNLARYFADLFFSEKILIEAWQGVLCSEANQVAFLPLCGTMKMELSDINFAIEYLQKNKKVKTLHQSKIVYALALLTSYCPDINLPQEWDSFLKMHHIQKGKSEQNLLLGLKQQGMVFISQPQIKIQTAQSLSYLLDSQRHKKDNRYKKSSAIYIMLLILAYLILQHF